MARGAGIGILQAAVMSLTNVTSAGQFAGLALIQGGAPFVEMAITQLIINLRYCLMSCALSQKLAPDMPLFHRFFIAYGVTDEIFGVSVCRPGTLSPFYSYGLIAVAVPGWTLGTVLGAVSGNLMPDRILSALGVALYGMFLAQLRADCCGCTGMDAWYGAGGCFGKSDAGSYSERAWRGTVRDVSCVGDTSGKGQQGSDGSDPCLDGVKLCIYAYSGIKRNIIGL